MDLGLKIIGDGLLVKCRTNRFYLGRSCSIFNFKNCTATALYGQLIHLSKCGNFIVFSLIGIFGKKIVWVSSVCVVPL